MVDDVVLDTGCACAMVRQYLVPKERLVAGATVRLRCAHGDVVTYPLAAVKLEIDGVSLPVTAAVEEKLLLGTDIPELGKLMNQHPHSPMLWLLPDPELKPADRLRRRLGTSRKEQSQVQWRKPIRSPPWMLTCFRTLQFDSPSHVERNAKHDTATASSERRITPDTCGERPKESV